MIKDETIKKISKFLTRFNFSTITTLNQINIKGQKEKSLYLMYFLKNKKICFDVIFRKNYFFITDFSIEAV